MGKALCPVAWLTAQNSTADASNVHLRTVVQKVEEYLPVLSTCHTDSKLKKAEGLIETRIAWDDFTVGWHVLKCTDLSLELLSIFAQLICIHKYKLCSPKIAQAESGAN